MEIYFLSGSINSIFLIHRRFGQIWIEDNSRPYFVRLHWIFEQRIQKTFAGRFGLFPEWKQIFHYRVHQKYNIELFRCSLRYFLEFSWCMHQNIRPTGFWYSLNAVNLITARSFIESQGMYQFSLYLYVSLAAEVQKPTTMLLLGVFVHLECVSCSILAAYHKKFLTQIAMTFHAHRDGCLKCSLTWNGLLI